ncbi:MAG: Npt1/Npt2 family nucleotide transporter [Bryobacteraceae bacterium]
MLRLKEFWRSLWDIRRGERLITVLMALYMLFVLFAYYILKPVSRALFLNKFDIDKLPWLYILIAAVGGVLAYVYTKVAVKTTLSHAVTAATVFLTACLFALWWLLRYEWEWVLYAFNVWLSLFSVVLVSQGWLVAANLFDSRQAKRLYGILGLGAVLGAAFGGTFTSLLVRRIGPRHLLLASAVMVVMAYGVFRVVAALRGAALATARGAEEEGAGFSFKDLAGAIGRHRHLQVIIAIFALTYMVDVMIEYQFSAMAKQAFPDKNDLTAFLGSFYGLYLNLATFALQFFLTAVVVARFGVGGALQAMPVSIGVASAVTYLTPGLTAAAGARLAEASTRYSFNRTGMELLYLPLPTSLKNRTKAFIDVFADRFSRGLGGVLLLLLTVGFGMSTRSIALVALGFSLAWILLSERARRQYVATVRKQLEMRRLDLESIRINVRDVSLLRLLQETARGPNGRQAAYALGLLAEAPDYPLAPLLEELAGSPLAEVRAKVFELARASHLPGLLDQALAEIRARRPREQSAAVKPAVAYALAISPEPADLARRLLDHPDLRVIEGAVEALTSNPDVAQELITRDWLAQAGSAADAGRRRVAAVAVGVRGDEGTEVLHRLLKDPDPGVAAAACKAAGSLGHRTYVDALIQRLGDSRVRRDAIEALAAFGPRIAGTLGDVLKDERVPVAIRQQAPRVLRRMADQRSVDVLWQSLGQPNLGIRSAVLRALNGLRETAPNLRYDGASVTQHIYNEVRYYYELSASAAPFREFKRPRTAVGLLADTLDERLQHTLGRLFRLLGLRYPPREIYATYLAIQGKRQQAASTALEFLDNILDRDIKRYLLPVLDASGHQGRGRELFGIPDKDVTAAIRELIRSGDPWLTACAMAAAADLRLHGLRPEILEASRNAGAEVGQVGERAVAALA